VWDVFSLVVRFDCVDPDAAEKFDALVAELVTRIGSAEPGTLLYVTNTVEGEPLARVFFEVYRDRDAFAEHERQNHVVRFHEARAPYTAGARVEFLSPGPATGLDGPAG
jgi:quinol monooxygenase YgiN